MKPREMLDRRFWVLYPTWILLCVGLIFGMRNVAGDSRVEGRLESDDAGRAAIAILQQRDPASYADYDVVNVAYSRGGELGTQARWVVLCDEIRRSGLERAVVVELTPTGKLIRIRGIPEE